MEWYRYKKDNILSELGAEKNGFTKEKAEKLLNERGENVLEDVKKKSILSVFFQQFKDLLVIILIIAGVISMFSGNVESTIVIIAVIVLNAILGTVQHVKAEKSLDSLKSLSSPWAKVIRNGEKIEIPSKYVVPGDIVILEAGDLVVADGRILENYSLQVNESSLTGESENVNKEDKEIDIEVPLGDRVNMVYSGSLVTYGRSKVVVTSTGMDREIGKIAALMNGAKDKKTPLQQSLDKFSGKLAAVIMVICAVVFGLSLLRGMELLDSMMFAVALAVAAIPEALGSIVTIVQAIGTQKMARENAIIKELKAVESLGSVSVICSDKTGTLTQNKMTVKNIYLDGEVLVPEKLDIKNQIHRYLLYNAVLTNDSSIVDGNGVGDPTEYALLEMYHKVGGYQGEDGIKLHENEMRSMIKRIEEVPFDSDRKLMSTKHSIRGKDTIFTKGALDVLLDRCISIRTSEGIRKINEKDMEDILNQNHKFSKNGLRVLAFGYKETEEELSVNTEYDYIFLGLIAMIDPPRPEAIDAVEKARTAGIKTIMITGDHKITAVSIAKEIGIFMDGHMAVTGMELDKMTDEELDGKIEKISVYARVSPENKIRIVESWQRRGNIVAMTGDGVNDAPALKKADIGVAMGITGTEVSKDAASIILGDDNFATIIKAVANGRNVYRNIKNAIMFLLSGNMAGIFAVLYTSLLGLPIPFAPVHLLFINLVTDSLPAIAIGMEPGENDTLKEGPRNHKEGILTKDFLSKLFIQGLLIGAVTIIGYHIGLVDDKEKASTVAFSVLTIARLFHGFNCRSKKSLIDIGFKKNWYSLGAFVLGVFLVIFVLFVPFMKNMFSVVDISIREMGIIFSLAFIPTFIIQIKKMLYHR